MEKYSFQRGLNEVKSGERAQVRNEIMAFLEITSNAQWHQRKNGNIIPKVDEKEGIENIFLAHKVKKSMVWGTTEKIPQTS